MNNYIKPTYTVPFIEVQLKAVLTSTHKTSWCIDAKLTALSIFNSTLIYI